MISSDLLSLIGSSSFSFKVFKGSTCFFPWSSIVFACFSKALARGEEVNLAYSIICFWLEGSNSSPVRYSYFSSLPNDKGNIFKASLLISYCRFSSLI